MARNSSRTRRKSEVTPSKCPGVMDRLGGQRSLVHESPKGSSIRAPAIGVWLRCLVEYLGGGKAKE